MTEHFGGRAKRGSDGRVRYLAKVNLGLKMASKELNHLIYEGYFKVTYHKGSITLSFSYLCHMTIFISYELGFNLRHCFSGSMQRIDSNFYKQVYDDFSFLGEWL